MINVLVVDDSVVVRRLIVDALGGAANIKVVGTAANGVLAQAKIDQLKPDIITMDIEMPQMDGIDAVRELRKRHPKTPVIMFSTVSAAGAFATLEALAAGATDYVTKPSHLRSVAESIGAVREQLVPKIIALAGSTRSAGVPTRLGPAPARPGPAQELSPPAAGNIMQPRRPNQPGPGPSRHDPAAPGPAVRRGPRGRVDILAIGASTGGPDALTKVLAALPGDLPVPIVITQHMPPVFTRMFAERLARTVPMTVVEAADGMAITPGTAYLAPGDKHLLVIRHGTATVVQLSGAPPENSCRPAVDVMFRSVARLYGRTAFGAVLTGMGQDGRGGAKVLRDAGAEVLAQDEASSVVWGMPGAVVGAGLADDVQPLNKIASSLLARVQVGRSAAVAR